MDRLSSRLKFLLCSSLIASTGMAQKSVEHDQLIRLSGMNGPAQEKVVLSAVKDQDPGALITIAPTLQHVKARTGIALDRELLEQRLTPWGIVVLSVGPLGSTDAENRSAMDAALPCFPQHNNTGDAAVDEADYQERKAQWIAEHPELYPPVTHDEADPK